MKQLAALSRLADLRGVGALLLVFVLGCIFSPKVPGSNLPVFLAGRTQIDILFEYCEYGLLAVGMTLVILTGGIDLSVGSVLGLSATVFALLTVGLGLDPGLALIALIPVGLLAGCVNGLLVSRLGMQPFVVTLAMMTAARGLARLVAGGVKVQPAGQPWYRLTEGTPDFFLWMTRSLPGIGLQPAALTFLAVILAMGIVVRWTAFGRSLYAIGGNEEAARLSGIGVARSKVLAYSLCGGCAALAGAINACRQDLGDPEAGLAFELDAIAAVVIGGTSLAGGRGGMGFTFLGVLIIAYINKILSLNAVPVAPRMMVQALIIIVAVIIQQRHRGRSV